MCGLKVSSVSPHGCEMVLIWVFQNRYDRGVNKTPSKPTNRQSRPFVIALTGGIASGKTAASDAFAALGVPIIDTDVIARQVVAPESEGLRQVVDAFGPDVLNPDGSLDRRTLRSIIFADPPARLRLEGILHPLIAQSAMRQLSEVEAPYALLVVPLLVESGLFTEADRVLVIDVPERVQRERLMERDQVSEDQAGAALNAQIPRQQRLERADDVLSNTGTREALREAVQTLHQRYLQLAAGAA